jgi:fluoroquinolone resistance protein
MFNESSYEGRRFQDVDCQGQDINFKTFTDCTFVGCQFNESRFNECTFHDCTFKSCDLSLVQVKHCVLSGVRLEESKALGVNWTEINQKDSGRLAVALGFTACTISYSTFFGMNLKKTVLTRCTAHDVDFAEADLTGTDCTHTDFTDSRFFKTNLTKVDFTRATNYSIAVNTNTVKKTRFSLPEALSLLYNLDIVLVE